jgi:hypothetical protein
VSPVVIKNIPDTVVQGDSFPASIASVFLMLVYLNIIITHLPEIRALKTLTLLTLLAVFISISVCSYVLLPIPILSITLSVGITLSLLSPVCAVNVLVAALLARPWELATPNPLLLTLPKLYAGVGMASFALHLLITRSWKLHWCPSVSIFVCWVGWIFADTLLLEGDTSRVVENFFPAATVALLLYNTPNRLIDLALVRTTIMTSITCVMVNAYYFTITYASLQKGRLETIGYWSNSNDLGALIAVAIPIASTALFLGNKKRFESGKATAFIALLFLLVAAWHTQSRATFIAAGLCFAAAGSFALPKQFLFLKTLVGVLILSGSLGSMVLLSRSESDLEGSSTSRKAMILAGLSMAKSSPFLGVGFQQYPKNFERHTTSFLESGERDAHNSWVLPLAETGIFGFILFTLLMLSVIKNAWLVRKEYPLFFCVLISYFLTMSFLTHTYLFLPYLLCGWVLGGVRVVRSLGDDHFV